MAARQEVTLIISARDKTRAVFRGIGDRLKRFRRGLGGIAAAVGLGALAKSFLGVAESVDAASRRLGVSRETLQALRLQGKRVGVEFTSIVSIIQRLNRNAGDAGKTNIKLRNDFKSLGISLDDLRNANPEDIFFKVADAVREAGEQGVGPLRQTLAIVGRLADVEGVALRGLLIEGGDALIGGAQALKEAGKIRSEAEIAETAAKQRAAAETLAEVQARLADVMEQALPAVEKIAEGLQLILDEGVRDLAKEDVLNAAARAQAGLQRAGGPAARAAGPLAIAGPAALAAGTLAQKLDELVTASKETAVNTADSGQWR